MFRRLDNSRQDQVEIYIDEMTQTVPINISVAAALLMFRKSVRSTPIGDRPRGPFCMMGICFDCLVNINGVPNQRACMVTVDSGMRVKTGHSIVSVESPK